MTNEEAVEELFKHVKQEVRETIDEYRKRVTDMFDTQVQIKDAILEVNKEYFIVKGPINDGVIHKIGKDARGHLQVRPVKKENFRTSLENKKIYYKDGRGDDQQIPYSVLWLSARQRNERQGIVFDPSAQTPKTHVNLWQEWKYKPRMGNWSLYQQLIRNGIAAGEEELFDYVLNWMSHVVQKPTERMDVALCITGEEGVGKSVFGQHFGELFGQHYVQLATLTRLTAQFNALIKDKLLMQVDEAYVGGSRNDSLKGALNDLITSPETLVEHKGFEVERYTNYLHFIITSNNRVFVPAGTRGRRFAVLEASNTYYEDFDFFVDMAQQMKEGGYEALMYELVSRNISGFQPRNVPRTQARANQVLANIDSVEEWLRSLLRAGEWPNHILKWHKNRSWQEYEYSIPKTEAYALYEEYWIRNSFEFGRIGKHKVLEDDFGRRLSELLSSVQRNESGHYCRRLRNNTERFEMVDRPTLLWAYYFPKWSDILRELAYRKGVEPEQYIS